MLRWSMHGRSSKDHSLLRDVEGPVLGLESRTLKRRPDPGRCGGISIEDKDEIEKRAAEARSGAPGIAWG